MILKVKGFLYSTIILEVRMAASCSFFLVIVFSWTITCSFSDFNFPLDDQAEKEEIHVDETESSNLNNGIVGMCPLSEYSLSRDQLPVVVDIPDEKSMPIIEQAEVPSESEDFLDDNFFEGLSLSLSPPFFLFLFSMLNWI